ncbi:hypothetical protein NDU88_005931 [Pleurodeles waltl]|uniref:Uncharacterized protein n=1 Tax=Pleurodeles waltl TaxID=8319 RepID=A0AAV7WBZ0_PLEWA|nr:hypothetical protein NDU88_005931 [Pleurodeles waltl]
MGNLSSGFPKRVQAAGHSSRITAWISMPAGPPGSPVRQGQLSLAAHQPAGAVTPPPGPAVVRVMFCTWWRLTLLRAQGSPQQLLHSSPSSGLCHLSAPHQHCPAPSSSCLCARRPSADSVPFACLCCRRVLSHSTPMPLHSCPPTEGEECGLTSPSGLTGFFFHWAEQVARRSLTAALLRLRPRTAALSPAAPGHHLNPVAPGEPESLTTSPNFRTVDITGNARCIEYTADPALH